MTTIRASACFALFLTTTAMPAAAPPAPPDAPVVLLWPNGAPGSEGKTGQEVVDDKGVVTNVHKPSITVMLPARDKATGAAVLVCPGGGHRLLVMEHEGYDIGRWLNSLGVAAFVLKYRLAREPNSTYALDREAPQDASRALRVIRSRAAEWHINPARIGVMGFSAGGEVVMYASARFDRGNPQATDPIETQSSRPDFQVLVYPGPLGSELPVPQDAPPAFLVSAYDDNGPAVTVAKVFLALKSAGVPAELHVYNRGGHGFGIRTRPMPVSTWPERFKEWLSDSALSGAPPSQ
jgi:acetyl esterase/lipase